MGFYETGAKILNKLDRKEGTIKSLVFSKDVADSDKKRMFALVCETLKYKEVLGQIIRASEFGQAKPKIQWNLALVLVYDFLFGERLSGAGPYKAVLLKHKPRLQAELARLKIKRKVTKNEELVPEHIRNAVVLPRYVRVNTIKLTVDKAIVEFRLSGYRLVDSCDFRDLSPKSFFQDAHIPEIFVFPSNADFHEHTLYLNGSIILQDKASCFPAYILSPPPHSVAIDACAAPGNKTSHLSAIMQNTGTIFAFDQDRRRLQTLERLTHRAGCKNIVPKHVDFLTVNPKDPDYEKVEYILLDPSCSGSGIVRRLDHLINPGDEAGEQENEASDPGRVRALADFQLSALLHAFKFPSVKRVVYSTCSKHREENEDVVHRALSQQQTFRLAHGVFPAWRRRGLPGSDGHEELVRTEPRDDLVIGFFVALFERQPASS
ncbi:S-adenosyl-L-methionine-dependent methyltransferase [Zopfochytrium polystomum]|nr:S-adenosyl-L-methionine-dependent methyltransferase [Zopfochytrium polystomum]